MKIKVGDIYKSRSGEMVVESAESWDKVVVRFIATGYTATAQAGNVERGAVKDPYHPFLYGVGFFGEGSFRAYSSGSVTREYNAWMNMITRCYSGDYHKKKPTYKDCSVCEDWHNFQVFAEWFRVNYIDGMQLDKDKLSIGSKVYSPDTCVFITLKENAQISNSKRYLLTDPNGKEHDVHNLAEFCRENDLCDRNMNSVCSGKKPHHKRWTGIKISKGEHYTSPQLRRFI